MGYKDNYKWNFEISKNARILRSSGFWNPPRIPRILAILSDLQNSTCKYPYRTWEDASFLLPRGSHRYPHSYRPKKLILFACHFEYLKVENPQESDTFFGFAKFHL
jgi:hypothetical protein